MSSVQGLQEAIHMLVAKLTIAVRSTPTTRLTRTLPPSSRRRRSTAACSRLAPRADRGGSVQDMRSREPAGSTCDCSMFTRWAFAQAGIDIGTTTSVQWTANSLLPAGDSSQRTGLVARGVGPDPPPGGYQPADLIFFGVDDGPNGHVALWLGNGMIVQCSSSGGGSNIRPLSGYASPTGWGRWAITRVPSGRRDTTSGSSSSDFPYWLNSRWTHREQKNRISS